MQNTDTKTVEISVSADNIARYNKRLQKALCEHFGQKIPLNVASNLLAKTFGKSNEFELQKMLQETASKDVCSPSVPEKSAQRLSGDAGEVHDYILNYLKYSKETNIVFADYVFLATNNETFNLKIGVWSKDRTSIEWIGLSLGTPGEININTENFSITEKDVEFLQNVLNACAVGNIGYRGYMLSKMKNHLNIKPKINRTTYFALYRGVGLSYIKGDLLEKEEFFVMRKDDFKAEIKGQSLIDNCFEVKNSNALFAESLITAYAMAELDDIIVKVVKVLKTGKYLTRFWVDPYKKEVSFASKKIGKIKFKSKEDLDRILPEIEGMLDGYSNSVEPYYVNKIGIDKYFDKYQMALKDVKFYL